MHHTTHLFLFLLTSHSVLAKIPLEPEDVIPMGPIKSTFYLNTEDGPFWEGPSKPKYMSSATPKSLKPHVKTAPAPPIAPLAPYDGEELEPEIPLVASLATPLATSLAPPLAVPLATPLAVTPSIPLTPHNVNADRLSAAYQEKQSVAGTPLFNGSSFLRSFGGAQEPVYLQQDPLYTALTLAKRPEDMDMVRQSMVRQSLESLIPSAGLEGRYNAPFPLAHQGGKTSFFFFPVQIGPIGHNTRVEIKLPEINASDRSILKNTDMSTRELVIEKRHTKINGVKGCDEFHVENEKQDEGLSNLFKKGWRWVKRLFAS